MTKTERRTYAALNKPLVLLRGKKGRRSDRAGVAKSWSVGGKVVCGDCYPNGKTGVAVADWTNMLRCPECKAFLAEPGRSDDPAKPADADADGPPPPDKGKDAPPDDSRDDGPGTIQGYAAVAYSADDPGTQYELWADEGGRAVERLAAGAFREAMDRKDDVAGLYNHEPDLLLGRTGSGTLRLVEDERGLRYEIDLPDTQTGRDVASLVARGDLTGSSFGFVVEQESWRDEADSEGNPVAVRIIESVRLLDVGPVTYPAYAATSVGRSSVAAVPTGSVQEARASYQKWQQQKARDRGAEPLGCKLAQIRARAVQVQRAG